MSSATSPSPAIKRIMSNTAKSAANAGTTRIVKEYVKRLSSHDLEEYPAWNLEKPLPKLPVPTLSQTLERYLKVLGPITTTDQYERAKQLVQDFQKEHGEGHDLQARLHNIAANTDNWAYDWWLDDMYLQNQAPLPINSNPGMVFPRVHFTESGEQLRFAARLVSGILDYKVIIDARGLPIDRCRHREKGQPLCMEQYYRLFTTYREPGLTKDRLLTTENNGSEPEHIIVICRNKLFKLDVVNGMMRLSEDDICCQLRRITRIADDTSSCNGDGLGILTTLPRNEWSKARQILQKDPTNANSLREVERSMFVLCLDKSIPIEFNHRRSVDDTDHKLRDDNSLALQMLHGQGAHKNSCNRWYDKTMQFIIGEDGACGLNYEHSPSEGIAVVQLIEHVLKYMEELRKRKLVRMNSIVELPYPTQLTWNISNESIQQMDMAMFEMDKSISNLDFYLLRFNKYGKEFPKTQNMSPDCLIQLALQLTYYRVHGKLVSTYESASVRRFRLGRVDNIRAASNEALLWCKAMTGEFEASDEEKMKLLRDAMQSQTDFMVQTILGYGMDCHMLALKRIAEHTNHPQPELFEDETWNLSNQFILSTSQILTTLDSFMGYGPVVHNGYGASYNPHPDSIVFCISSFKECETTRSDQFAMTLESVLLEVYDLCMNLEAKKKNALDPIVEERRKLSSAGLTLPLNANGTAESTPRQSPSTSGDTTPNPSPRRLVRQKEVSSGFINGISHGVHATE